MPTLESYNGYYLWHFVPSLPLAVVFGCIFAFWTSLHAWKMFKTRMWLSIPFVVGGNLEVIGYICRGIATYNTGVLMPYLIQGIFLILSPVLFAASIYMVYSRIVRAAHGESFSLVSPKWTTRIFVAADIFCLLIQSAGSGLLAKAGNEQTGDNIIVAGLVLQITVFLGFIACCLVFQRRFRAHLAKTGTQGTSSPWQASLNMLYGTSGAILVRNIFRVVEFVIGSDHGYLADHEWPLYVFDGVPMVLAMAGFFFWYPSQLQRSARDLEVEMSSEMIGTFGAKDVGTETGGRWANSKVGM